MLVRVPSQSSAAIENSSTCGETCSGRYISDQLPHSHKAQAVEHAPAVPGSCWGGFLSVPFAQVSDALNFLPQKYDYFLI